MGNSYLSLLFPKNRVIVKLGTGGICCTSAQFNEWKLVNMYMPMPTDFFNLTVKKKTAAK